MMPQLFPYVAVQASALNGDLVSTLNGDVYFRQLTRLTISGPAGSTCKIYLGAIADSNLVDQTSRGQSNTAEYTNPITILPGTSVYVVWPGQAGNAASATFYMQRL